MKNRLTEITLYFITIVIIIAFIALDFFVLKPSIGVNTGINYWLNVGVNTILILIEMLLVRLIRKKKKIQSNQNIHIYQNKLDNTYKIISNLALHEDLEKFIVNYNDDTKYATFIRELDYKIAKCKNPEKKKKLIEKRKLPKEEVIKMNVRYTRISSNALYSNVFTKVKDDKNEITAHEFRDNLKMVLTKATAIVLGVTFTGAIIVDTINNGMSVIVSTILKMIMMATGIIMAILQADNFVDGEIEGVLRKRLRISVAFVNSNPLLKQACGINNAQNLDYKPENDTQNAQICENIAKNTDYD